MSETPSYAMPPEWRAFMTTMGALISADRVQHFGNPVQEIQIAASGEIIADLSHFTLVSAQGNDAEKFLQGQFTNDIREVSDGLSQLSAYCSPKGRALAVTRFFRRDDCYYFILPAALLESTLSRLRKYIMMSKVTLKVLTDWGHIGYADPRGGGHLRDALGTDLPATVNEVVHIGGVTVIRVAGGHARFELCGELALLQSLWRRLHVHAAQVGGGPWEYLDIQAGLPCVYPETVDTFVPQMLNLGLLGGISFKKGCYTGQEVVARTHYLGKLKRRMYRLHCADHLPPAPGTAIFNTAMRADESAGSVVRAQAAPDGGSELLAVLHIDAGAAGELRLGGPSGALCHHLPLPYTFDAAD